MTARPTPGAGDIWGGQLNAWLDETFATKVGTAHLTDAAAHTGTFVLPSSLPVVRVEDVRAGGTDTAAINAAIAALPANGGIIEFAKDRAYTPTAAWNIDAKKQVVFRGANAGTGVSTGLSTRINCGALAVANITIGAAAVTESVRLEGLTFDGTNNNPAAGAESTSWPGAFVSNKVSTPVSLFTENLTVVGSKLEGAIGLDLRRLIWVDMQATRISQFQRGRSHTMGAAGTTTTTISARKCYFTYNREGYHIDATVTDVHYDGCVFESSTVVGSGGSSKVHFTDCYFENIGHTTASGPFSAGLPNKNNGINFGAGILDTAVVAAFTDLYGTYTFDSCRFAYLAAGGWCAQWFHGAGRGSASGGNGACRVRGSTLGDAAFPFFRVEERSSYSYEIDDGGVFSPNGAPVCRNIAEARRLTRGLISLEYPAPTYNRTVRVESGKLRLGYDEFTYTATPSDSPTSGAYAVGDRLTVTAPVVGGYIEYVCTTAGSPGTWTGVGVVDTDIARLPWLIDIDVIPTAISHIDWDLNFVSASNFYGIYKRSGAGTQNNEINWDVVLGAGTWTLELTHDASTDVGIYTVQLDGVSVGTIDGYAAAYTINRRTDLAGIVVATSGKKRLKLKMATKNPSSTGFFGYIQHLQLRRTA